MSAFYASNGELLKAVFLIKRHVFFAARNDYVTGSLHTGRGCGYF